MQLTSKEKVMAKQILGALAMASLCVAPAIAADYPKIAYDAKYSMKSPQGASEMRMASDGAGKLLTATKMGGMSSTSIVDYTNMTSTTLIDANKMAMVNKLPATQKYMGDADAIKKNGGKDLGSKTVAGHPCHGWEYTNGGAKSECWIGNDVKVMVQSTTTTPQGKTVMTLTSFKAGAPAASDFKIPAGYKMMKVPGAG
jgi:hypothetical protein